MRGGCTGFAAWDDSRVCWGPRTLPERRMNAKQPKGLLIKFFLPGFVLGLIVGGFSGVYVATRPGGPKPNIRKVGEGGPGATRPRSDDIPSEAPAEDPGEGMEDPATGENGGG